VINPIKITIEAFQLHEPLFQSSKACHLHYCYVLSAFEYLFMEADEECLVTFMRPSQARNTGNPLYKWPNPEDKIWLQVTDILCNLRELMKVGRSGRSYEIILNFLPKRRTNCLIYRIST
jgi:hypothetical protein